MPAVRTFADGAACELGGVSPVLRRHAGLAAALRHAGSPRASRSHPDATERHRESALSLHPRLHRLALPDSLREGFGLRLGLAERVLLRSSRAVLRAAIPVCQTTCATSPTIWMRSAAWPGTPVATDAVMPMPSLSAPVAAHRHAARCPALGRLDRRSHDLARYARALAGGRAL